MKIDTIRWIDCTFSIAGLIILLPVFTVIALVIKLTSKGPVFFRQSRVGKNQRDFKVYKFRSMYVESDKENFLSVDEKIDRVTPTGFYLLKFNLDELPLLLNVFKGEMSLVGPRPKVRKYVELYNKKQRKVLKVRPGLTEHAPIATKKENDLLAIAADSTGPYPKKIMPKKMDLKINYINNRSVKTYFKVILKTMVNSSRSQ
jgi:lipopolysaccharide/colanic/teichoic acid biosynthesis glycosyltransferase